HFNRRTLLAPPSKTSSTFNFEPNLVFGQNIAGWSPFLLKSHSRIPLSASVCGSYQPRYLMLLMHLNRFLQRSCIFLHSTLTEFVSCLPFSQTLSLCFRHLLPHVLLSCWVISTTPTLMLLRPGIDKLLVAGCSTLMIISSMASRH
ncbi:hypothetical protein PS6_009819, partial [Mucor atramentarius]